MQKYYLGGLMIGIMLAIANTFLLGIPGFFLVGPFHSLFSKLVHCSGEGCWEPEIFLGDVLLILTSLLVAFIIGRIKTNPAPTPLWIKNTLYWFCCFSALVILAFIIFGVF